MNYLQKSEKLLKTCFKERRSITLAFVVSFLINGGVVYADNVAAEKIEASKEETMVTKPEDSPNTTEIEIKKAENGISHNTFNSFSIDEGDIVLIKNNSEKEQSRLLELEREANRNFKSKNDEASLIIAEVEKAYGNKSRLAGSLEVLGRTADLVIANENGIEVNGQRFVNTNSVTLTTGKYDGSISKDDIQKIDKVKEHFKVNGGEVSIDGNVNLQDTKYFNVLAKHINILESAKIGSHDGLTENTKELDIGLYSDNKTPVAEAGNDKLVEAAGISALGSMYANKITLRTFGNNSIINTDKMITAKEEINIDSETGRISLDGNISSKKINITTAAEHKNTWNSEQNGPSLTIDNKSAISAESLTVNSKSADDLQNVGKNLKVEKEFNLNLKDKLTDGKNLTKKIEKRFEEGASSDLPNNSDNLEYFLDAKRLSVGEKINLKAGDENYTISTQKKEQPVPEVPAEPEVPEKPVEPEAPVVPPKVEIPWTDLTPAKVKINTLNGIEISDKTTTELAKVEGHEKATLVNIAAPKVGNSKISHNVYKKFSIDKDETVLLNNQTKGKKANSKLLSKEIAGNEALDESTNLVINEVENNKQEATTLAGGLEVLGQKADVVIANEEGIIVNGGRFENIGNLDLSTGRHKENINGKNTYGERKGNLFLRGEGNSSTLSNLRLYGNNVLLNGNYSGNSIEAEASGALFNTNEIRVKDQLNLKGKTVQNSGLLKAGQALNIQADTVKNAGINKSGKIVSDGTLNIATGNLENKNSVIFSEKDMKIEATGEIKNTDHATIQSQGNLELRGKTILNEASSIKSAGELNVFTNHLKNYSGFRSIMKEVETPEHWIRKIRIKESWIKSWFNGYQLTLRMNKKQMNIEVDDSTLDAGKNLTIRSYEEKSPTKTIVENRDGLIRARKNIDIEGEVQNLTSTASMKADDLLSGISVDLDWNTSSLVDGSIFQTGTDGKNLSLKDVLKGKINLHGGPYYRLLRGANIPEIDRILNLALGGDWKAKERAASQTTGGEIRYYSKDKRATITSGGNIHIKGKLTNSPAADFLEQSNGRKVYVDPKVPVEYELATIGAEGTTVQKEKEEVIEKVNYDVKRAKDFLSKENGIYKRAEKNAKYEYLSSDFITSRAEHKGYDYLNAKLKEAQKTKEDMKVIGDNYYQYNMIKSMLQSSDVVSKHIGEEKVGELLDNASKEAERLQLKIGVPLTEEQKKNLKEHIVWYVETENNGNKVLIPVVYSSESKGMEEAKEVKKSEGLSSIAANENVSIESDSDVQNRNSSISSGERLEIKAKEKISLEDASLAGQKGLHIQAKDVDIKASELGAKEGKLRVKAENTLSVEDKKKVESSYRFTNTGNNILNVVTEETNLSEKSKASSLSGKDISLAAGKDVKVQASGVKAENSVKIAGENVNIVNSTSKAKEELHRNKNGFENGKLIYHSDTQYKKEEEKVNKSSVEGKSFEITADKNIHIQASDLKAKETGSLSAKEKLSIENTTKASKESLSAMDVEALRFNNVDKTIEKTTVESAKVEAGNLVANAKDIVIKSSSVKAEKAEINASQKVDLKAAAETLVEKSTSTSIGIFGKASAGGLGLGGEASFDTAKEEMKAEVINDYDNKRVKHKKSKLPALANAETGVKLNVTSVEKEEKIFKNADLNFGENGVQIHAKSTIDLGGADIVSSGDVNVKAKEIKTTKEKNERKEKVDSFELSVKQSGALSSSVLDAANAAKEIAEEAQAGELNEGLAAAKAIGAATNLLFNDAAGANSIQSANLSYNHTKSSSKEDVKNKIQAKNLNLTTTDGDIELNNVAAKVDGKANLDAAGNLKLKSGEKEVKKEGYGFNIEGRQTQTAGANALFGANSQLGFGATVGANYENFEGKYHDNTKILAKEVETKSKDSTELVGAEIRAEEKAKISTGKDLIVKSQVDEYSGVNAKANLGLNVSGGVASSTLVAGRVSALANAGALYENGKVIKEQSGIQAGETADIHVKNNLVLDAASLGSDTKKGKLVVEKNIVKKDLETKEQSGGGIYGGSGGMSGEFGFDAEVGDEKDKQERQNSVIALEKDNIQAESIKDNGKEINKEDVETDLSKKKEVLKDSFKKGGTASGSFSVKDTKTLKSKVKKAIEKRAKRSVNLETAPVENRLTVAAEETVDTNVAVRRELPAIPEADGAKSKEKIYEDIDVPNKAKVEVEESPYESLDTIRKEVAKAEDPYASIADVKKEVANAEPIYAKVDLSKKTPKVESPEAKAKRAAAEKTEQYGEKKSVVSEDNADYMTIRRVKEKVEEATNLSKRELPAIPEANTAKAKEKIYEDIDAPNKAKVEVEESPYESLDTIRKEVAKAEDPYASIADVKKEVANAEPIYAKVDLSKKTPKVESAEDKAKREAAEKTEQYGEKKSVVSEDNADYMTIKRLKEKVEEGESLSKKAKEKVEESIYEDVETLRKTSEVEDPYASIEDLKKEVAKKEADIEDENPYETFENIQAELAKDNAKVEVAAEKPAEKDYSLNKAKGIGNTKYIPKELSKAEKKALFDQAKQAAKDKDSAKVAEGKLELIADNSKAIPKEHLLKALKELAYGLSLEDATALRNKSQETGKKINRPDVIEGFEGKNVKNMGKALKNIEFEKEYIQIRENINQKIVDKLDSNKEFHDLMKTKLSGNEEGIKKLFSMVEEAKRDALKEVTGIEGKKASLNLNTENGPLSMKQGHYSDNSVNMNAVPILSFLRTKKQNNKEILDTVVHELTHHDQAQITKNKDKDIPENMKIDAELLALNDSYYIGSDLNTFSEYKNQPLEREAFFSGHKLGEKLSKLVDKGYTDTSKELKIEHLPNTNKNLEAPKEERTDLGNNALIYGLKSGREELIHRANKADTEKKNPILADSYIGKLNLGYEFSHLSDLAKKVNEGKVTEQDVEAIANFSDPVADTALISSSRSRINKANLEDNKKIISELLKNEAAVNALKTMDDLYEKGKVLTEELKKNEYVDIDRPKTSPSFTKEQNKTIDDYHAVQDGLNKTRMDFFSEKTKLIAKETLERGGQVYFALDGLATDSMRFDKDKTKIDFDNLKKLFDPKYEHYDAVTSHELRYLYENFKDNPNLKFTIKDQVIENPLKNLEIPKEFQK